MPQGAQIGREVRATATTLEESSECDTDEAPYSIIGRRVLTALRYDSSSVPPVAYKFINIIILNTFSAGRLIII